MGGSVPYTVIREVTENFIHAQFSEIVISILDQGKTIRFSDQGPGIKQKDKAQLPGFTSATEAMKRYIRGVGSGLPIVKDYLDVSNGTITIEDNLEQGAVVTISMAAPQGVSFTQSFTQQQSAQIQDHLLMSIVPRLTDREKTILTLMLQEGVLGVTDLVNLTGVAASSTYAALKKLEEYGLVEKTNGQKRILTDYGFTVAQSLRA